MEGFLGVWGAVAILLVLVVLFSVVSVRDERKLRENILLGSPTCVVDKWCLDGLQELQARLSQLQVEPIPNVAFLAMMQEVFWKFSQHLDPEMRVLGDGLGYALSLREEER